MHWIHRLFVVPFVLLILMGLASSASAKLPFKPGHYMGTTSQTCPPELADAEDCQAGEKLPISFMLTGEKVSRIEVSVAAECEDGSWFFYPMKFRAGFEVRASRTRGQFLAIGSLIKHGAGLTNDNVFGKAIKGIKARGELESLLTIDASGQLSADGHTYCNARNLHWQAQRVGG